MIHSKSKTKAMEVMALRVAIINVTALFLAPRRSAAPGLKSGHSGQGSPVATRTPYHRVGFQWHSPLARSAGSKTFWILSKPGENKDNFQLLPFILHNPNL